MKVVVQNKIIETKDIANIVDVEADKTMFLNREAGFKVLLINGDELVFSQPIPYESYPSEISAIKNKWYSMMCKVIEKWDSDKTEIEVISL